MSEKKTVVFDAYEYGVWMQSLRENIAAIDGELDKIIAANNAALKALNAPLPKPSAKRSWWRRLLVP